MDEQTVVIGTLGRVINLSDRRIQQLVKEGVLSRHKKGRYPFLSNVKAYVQYLQSRADGGGSVVDLEDARRRKLGAEARLAELELLKAEEQIISVDAQVSCFSMIEGQLSSKKWGCSIDRLQMFMREGGRFDQSLQQPGNPESQQPRQTK